MTRCLRLLVALALLGGCSADGSSDDDGPPAATEEIPDPPAGDSDPPDSEPPVDTDPPDPDPDPRPTVTDCFADVWDGRPPVDYASIGPVMGRHCVGTDHQDIRDAQRVVFVGDSVTLGTPGPNPDLSLIPASRWWRNSLAKALAKRFGLTPPNFEWQQVDVINGNPIRRFSGDFAVCAKYGARTDDLLLEPHRQLETCIPESERNLRTLILMTIGGNDIFALLEDLKAGKSEKELREQYEEATALLREAIEWIVEPGRFPNGVYVVFANTWEFTDADSAHDMASCPGAQLIGFDGPLRDPIVHRILADAAETYLQIAVDTKTDLVFMGEAFCGHGHDPGNTKSRCYRGPNAQVWFDVTCEHPSSAGHAAIHDLFLKVVEE